MAKDVLKFVETKQVSEETTTKIYYPFLYNKNIDTLDELKSSEQELIEGNKKILTEKTMETFRTVDMFYDVYKQGFAYYSDQNSLPYSVLNGAAMKYVIMFGCRDFYMDENFLPNDYICPLIKIFLEEDKPDKNELDDIEANIKTKTNKIDIKSGPFAKLKNYRFDEQKQPPNLYYNAIQTKNRSFFDLTTIVDDV